MNITYNKIFRFLAKLGLSLALIVHIISLFGIYIEDNFPLVWLLHVGVFVVWIPAVLGYKKKSNSQERNYYLNKIFVRYFSKIFLNLQFFSLSFFVCMHLLIF